MCVSGSAGSAVPQLRCERSVPLPTERVEHVGIARRRHPRRAKVAHRVLAATQVFAYLCGAGEGWLDPEQTRISLSLRQLQQELKR